LVIGILACRPVVTVGWQEIAILTVILAVLLGPALFRIYRRWDEFQRWKDNRDPEKKD
jgi:hypothetical protein